MRAASPFPARGLMKNRSLVGLMPDRAWFMQLTHSSQIVLAGFVKCTISEFSCGGLPFRPYLLGCAPYMVKPITSFRPSLFAFTLNLAVTTSSSGKLVLLSNKPSASVSVKAMELLLLLGKDDHWITPLHRRTMEGVPVPLEPSDVPLKTSNRPVSRSPLEIVLTSEVLTNVSQSSKAEEKLSKLRGRAPSPLPLQIDSMSQLLDPFPPRSEESRGEELLTPLWVLVESS